MAHHIYHTRGLIVGSVPTGESNRFYRILTEELGLIGATAQSVREEKSKLRYALQDYSWVTLDVVRGKEVWRITSAISGDGNSLSALKKKTFARLCGLVSRLVHGEGRQDALWSELSLLTHTLESAPDEIELLRTIEVLGALRIVAHLGYIPREKYAPFLAPAPYSEDLLVDFRDRAEKGAVLDINSALRESHL